MKHEEVFRQSKWITGNNDFSQQLIRGRFSLPNIKSAKITITGLGFFEFYINGKKVSNDKFVPAWTDYAEVERFEQEYKMTDEMRHRVFCLEYDVSSFLIEGENLIAIAIGGGWYAKYEYGSPKLCYLISCVDENGKDVFIGSDTNHVWQPSYISVSKILYGEVHDYNAVSKNWFSTVFDDSLWQNVIETDAPEAELEIQTCPADKLIRTIVPKAIKHNKYVTIYDAGENITGNVVISTDAKQNTEIEVLYSEEKINNNELAFDHRVCWGGEQKDIFITDGTKGLTAKAEFMWHGFRYFSVTNNAKPLFVEVIHADVPVKSFWKSDNDVLNWLYNSFINTQLCNMHAGIPSDCPHREGRGYTGDGQLAADTVMLLFEARRFYEKWLEDIYDCQNLETGHVQYTAPFVISGGGPGGWGGAIAIVPYVFYQHYGDVSVLKKFFPRIKLYFKYLEAHSENDLVVSDEPWAWCLGEWCTPEKITIPAPFVNNYFYIKTLEIYKNIASLINEEGEASQAEEIIKRKKQAIIDNYFNPENGDFCDNIQGANAFAIDINLHDERTIKTMLNHYKDISMFDTGIFGTDILTHILFEKGYAQLAFELLTSKEKTSFYNQMIQGATSLWEYWDGTQSRSHPMFGAVTKYLFYYLLGIKQKENTVGFKEIIVEPKLVKGLNYCEGKCKDVYVKYVKTDRDISFYIESPSDFKFSFAGQVLELSAGKHEFFFLKAN